MRVRVLAAFAASVAAIGVACSFGPIQGNGGPAPPYVGTDAGFNPGGGSGGGSGGNNPGGGPGGGSGGSSGGPTQSSFPCGSTGPCSGSQVCCLDERGASTNNAFCTTGGCPPGNITLTCNGSSSCGGGQFCCADSLGNTVCQPTCTSPANQVCSSPGDCSGATCMPTTCSGWPSQRCATGACTSQGNAQIACGGGTCTGSSVCCVPSGGALPFCIPQGSACAGVTQQCDDQADCPSGQVCCGDPNSERTACGAGCAPNGQVCTTTAECQNAQTCLAQTCSFGQTERCGLGPSCTSP